MCVFSCRTSDGSACRRTSRHTAGRLCVSLDGWPASTIVGMICYSAGTCVTAQWRHRAVIYVVSLVIRMVHFRRHLHLFVHKKLNIYIYYSRTCDSRTGHTRHVSALTMAQWPIHQYTGDYSRRNKTISATIVSSVVVMITDKLIKAK